MARTIEAKGETLRELRASAGLTQEELAEKAQVTPQTVSNAERGRSCLIGTLARLAMALDVPMSEIIARTSPPSPSEGHSTKSGAKAIATSKAEYSGRRFLESGLSPRYGDALFCLDVDDFTVINRVHGPHIGEVVLDQIETILETFELSKRQRSGDRLRPAYSGRFGADEFVVYIDVPRKDPTADAERLRRRIARYDWSTITRDLRVSTSIGVSVARRLSAEEIESRRMRARSSSIWQRLWNAFTPEGAHQDEPAESLFARSILGVRSAKAAGKNCVRLGPLFPEEHHTAPEMGKASDSSAKSGPSRSVMVELIDDSGS
ncbi:MAG: helix-turn-helix domain-containing protein [Deltaproteobacteria bacterium]|jgi:diguanylate cyclase (GGDEF)-like protein